MWNSYRESWIVLYVLKPPLQGPDWFLVARLLGLWVITCRMKNANLRTQLERIILRAGLKPWPKLFQILRATRETELAETFPIHVVCQWIGNSEVIAKKHLQVTEDHFRRAVEIKTESRDQTHNCGATPCDAAHKKSESPVLAGHCTGMHPLHPRAGDTGLEPVTPSLSICVSKFAEKLTNPLGNNGFRLILPRFPTVAIRLKKSHFVAVWCGSRGEKW
jgi:hypothetical protein